jgi:hypothetical protein
MAAKSKGAAANPKAGMKASAKTTPVTPPLAGWMGAKKSGKNPGVGKAGAMGKPTVRKK